MVSSPTPLARPRRGKTLRSIAAGAILLAEGAALGDFSYSYATFSFVSLGSVLSAVGAGILGTIAMTIAVGLFWRWRWAAVAGWLWAAGTWLVFSLGAAFALVVTWGVIFLTIGYAIGTIVFALIPVWLYRHWRGAKIIAWVSATLAVVAAVDAVLATLFGSPPGEPLAQQILATLRPLVLGLAFAVLPLVGGWPLANPQPVKVTRLT